MNTSWKWRSKIMLHRNRTILCAVLALLVLSLCACQAQSEHSGASASAPTSQETGDQIVSTQEVPCCAPREPMEIRTIDRVYAEVDQATIRELGLAVASCDGLTELGKIKDAGQTVTRPVYEKWGEEPTLTEVTVPETAYAHPDPRYPNLAVALVDGAPAIFQFCSFIAPYDGDLKLEDVYGPLNADTVKSVSVSIRREVHGSYEPKPQITDREAIAAFCDAFHAQYTLSDSELEEIAALHRRYNEWLPENAEGLEDAEIEAQRELHCGWLPEYLVDIELSNGFQVSLYYYPERFSYEYGMDGGLGSKQMNEWFDASGKAFADTQTSDVRSESTQTMESSTGDGSLC